LKKLKVITIVGTRPELIRLSRVIPNLDNSCDHLLVHTGQNYDYELNQIFFDDLSLRKPDYFLDAAGGTASHTIAKVIIEVEKILITEKPDAILVLGDTNSCMSVIPAKRLKIPIFHMEAGNRCFDMRVPEEINRRIVDHTADINLTYSSIAREYLLREGLSPDMVIKTGSPMFEVINHYRAAIDKSEILSRLDLREREFFVVSSHREENIDSDEALYCLKEILNTISKTYKFPIIFSTHPRTQKRISALGIKFDKLVRLMKPLSFTDYNYLQINSKAVLSDSGTINEEASILKFPALNIREMHERPEGMEEAAVMMVGLDKERVIQGLALLESQAENIEMSFREVSDYLMPNVSDKVVRIILSYINYVNRVTWKKY